MAEHPANLGTSNAADLNTAARRHLADTGEAMADGSYPIRNRTDLAKAVLALGRAKNPQAVKRHIIARARAIRATDLLPQSWNVTP